MDELDAFNIIIGEGVATSKNNDEKKIRISTSENWKYVKWAIYGFLLLLLILYFAIHPIDRLFLQFALFDNYEIGLVATSQETIRSSYSTAEIKVDLNNLVRTLHLGGLVGYISNVNGAVISNCYVGTANIVCVNNNYATANVGALVGYSNAQDTLSQICSFYLSTSLPAIINAPNGFNYQSFTNYTSLLNLLNSQDYAFKADGTNPPKLIWEA